MTHIDYQVNQGKKNKGGGQWTRYKKPLQNIPTAKLSRFTILPL